MSNNEIISNAITEIIGEFIETPDGDKQCFDITGTDGYEELCDEGLVNEKEVDELERIINDIVSSYGELCDRFGDKF